MSFIRMGQDSQYVDLHDGSKQYIYDNGHSIDGFGTYGQFIDALCRHAREAGMSENEVQVFERSLEDHYGEHRDYETQGIGPRPEMSHIVAQHLDSRLDKHILDDDLLEGLQEWAAKDFRECPDCQEMWRMTPYTDKAQPPRCRDCYVKELEERDLDLDVQGLINFVESNVPTHVEPEEWHDDEFYRLMMEKVLAIEDDEKKQVAHFKLAKVADEIQDAIIDTRPARKGWMLDQLEEVNE